MWLTPNGPLPRRTARPVPGPGAAACGFPSHRAASSRLPRDPLDLPALGWRERLQKFANLVQVLGM
ncbi:hypothetical protein GCM10018953_18320 [Streptosporangium nondiastaticum]